jgi:dTDP-4-dehydrorhamnose 3,5-epimerase
MYTQSMKFPSKLNLKYNRDSRGNFFELFSNHVKFQNHNFNLKQVNISYTNLGVLRGMHFQRGNYAQSKIIKCLQGSIFDICVEMNDKKPKKDKVYTNLLNCQEESYLLVPPNYAHGFQALEPNTIICYLVDNYYNPENAFSFSPLSSFLLKLWPNPITQLSQNDLQSEKF